MARELAIDIETYSPIDLATHGVYAYASHPGFQILLFAYSIDGGPVEVVDLAHGEKIPKKVFKLLGDSSCVKTAYNAAFERVCLDKATPTVIWPGPWQCTMVLASVAGLPGSLKHVAEALKLGQQKMDEGARLIKRFSCPTTEGWQDLPPATDPDWQLFKDYCKRDVEVEMAIRQRLRPLTPPGFVWQEYRLDQRINDRGVKVDTELASQALRLDAEAKQDNLERLKYLTGLENPNSPKQLLGWLQKGGVPLKGLCRSDVEEALKWAEDSRSEQAATAEVLRLRLESSKTSTKKYQAMLDGINYGRVRGLFQFYGASRTGRWSGRRVQLQNLPRNSIEGLNEARELVKRGDSTAIKRHFGSVPDTLPQLIRTAIVPEDGNKFIVADFSAIEARVLAWLAGEQWVLDAFREGKDLYCATASQMFRVPVEKHGVNSELRQKGKAAVLACIAEGEQVLTDCGLVPIEQVTKAMKVWDGEEWVSHQGLLFKGEREVITYEGLTATPDHKVWIQGASGPVPFGEAAACGAHLLQTGDGGRALRLGENYQPRKEVAKKLERVLRRSGVHQLRYTALDTSGKPKARPLKGLSAVLRKRLSTHTKVAVQEADSGEAKMHQSRRPQLLQLWGQRHRIPLRVDSKGGAMDTGESVELLSRFGVRSDRQQRTLRAWEHPFCESEGKRCQPKNNGSLRFRPTLLALQREDDKEKAGSGTDSSGDYCRGGEGRARKKEKLDHYRGKVRVYDLRLAGPRNRYTVSGKLVHNCGYQGATGAIKAMGGERMGLSEEEMADIVQQWRAANPRIVQFWSDVENAAKRCITTRGRQYVGRIRFQMLGNFLQIILPSGRALNYPAARVHDGRISHLGKLSGTRRFTRLETYGGKLVENITQAVARDILAHSMQTLEKHSYRIVMHVHDEVVCEGRKERGLVEHVCELMGRAPYWAEGLPLKAEGFESEYYKKD